MGIPNLLNLLKSVVEKRHIKEYKNKTIAVDVYTWLHPALFTCSYELANKIETTKHIEFCIKRIDTILAYGIKKIVLVFDGRKLPSKQGIEENREKSREESLIEAQKLLNEGKKDIAYRKFASSIDVTPQMAYELILAVKGKKNVECIVSPYEADAQLAYLSQKDYVDVVVSEDSDLITFGCKKVLLKLFKGDEKEVGDEISLEGLKFCKEINMSLWNPNMFLIACILTGCDYLSSLKKMGISTAFKLVGDQMYYNRILNAVATKFELPPGYNQKFDQAFLTFRFQFVYCPFQDRIVHLNPIEIPEMKSFFVNNEIKDAATKKKWETYQQNVLVQPLILKILSESFSWDFLGDMDLETAANVARCILDPDTLQPYKEIKKQEPGQGLQIKKSWSRGSGSASDSGPSGAGLSSLQNKNQSLYKNGRLIAAGGRQNTLIAYFPNAGKENSQINENQETPSLMQIEDEQEYELLNEERQSNTQSDQDQNFRAEKIEKPRSVLKRGFNEELLQDVPGEEELSKIHTPYKRKQEQEQRDEEQKINNLNQERKTDENGEEQINNRRSYKSNEIIDDKIDKVISESEKTTTPPRTSNLMLQKQENPFHHVYQVSQISLKNKKEAEQLNKIQEIAQQNQIQKQQQQKYEQELKMYQQQQQQEQELVEKKQKEQQILSDKKEEKDRQDKLFSIIKQNETFLRMQKLELSNQESDQVNSGLQNQFEKPITRIHSFSKIVDGQLVIDSRFLLKKHPEFNFLEKFSHFFEVPKASQSVIN